jgi:hypothetical protein
LPALALLPHVRAVPHGSKIDKRLQRLLHSKGLSARELATAHNALGHIYAKAGRYAPAFHHFTRGNRLIEEAYDHARDQLHVTLTRQHFRTVEHDDQTGGHIVFICGMPRSGTTLLEAALLRHPEVESIGESGVLIGLSRRARHMAALPEDAPGIDWANLLSPDQMADLRRHLLDALPVPASAGAIVLEKTPQHCFDVALAHLLAPQARFIHMMRHPLDCGLSNYITQFETGQTHSTRLNWIAQKIRCVEDLAHHHAAVLGPRYRLQSFRALVETPEPSLQAILAHIGLDWTADVLTPEKAQFTQRTASFMQVRQPISRAGLGKWRAFAKHLTPLIDHLGGPDWIAAWEDADADRHA